MSLQINTTLNTSDGGIVLSGSYLTFRVIFDNNNSVIAQPSLYRSYSNFTAGTASVISTSIPKVLRYTLTSDQYNYLTPIYMMGLFQTSIENIIGSGTTTIVS